MRLLERAAVGLDRPCERPTLMTEELAFDELSRKPSAIDRHERPVASRPSFMKRSGDVLFSDAGFASDQNGPRQSRKAIHVGHHGKHRSRRNDQLGSLLVAAAPADHAQDGPANSEHGARSKRMSANSNTVDPGAVGAPKVSDRNPL